MNLADIQTGLASLLSALSGVPCDWRRAPRVMHDSSRLQIDLVSEIALGVGESIWVTSSSDVVESVYTEHELVFQISAWSPRGSFSNSSYAVLSALKPRLRLETSRETLRGLGLAIVSIGGITSLEDIRDNRDSPGAAFDLTVAVGDSATETTAHDAIETSRVVSTNVDIDIDINPP